MRPVNRGAVPTDELGKEKIFSEYGKARGDLIDRLGEFCSYCEMHLDSALAVEHVLPKSIHPEKERDWNNFLLACPNCNSSKSKKEVELDDYFWPHSDNTFRTFSYKEGGIIGLAPELDRQQKEKALRTIQLTGLNKKPGNNYEASDRRWLNRSQAWDLATRSRNRLSARNIEEMRDTIVELAYNNGYWSIWMTVFEDDSDILNRLIQKFPGTSGECFDEAGLPLARPGGSI